MKILKSQISNLNKSFFNFKLLSNKNSLKNGIIYSLYVDKFNFIEVGYARNNRILEKKLIKEQFVLLDKKKGSIKELNLLKKTLNELGISPLKNKYFKYTDKTMRYLNTLGWPIGNSLYKHKVIKKKISYGII